MNRVPSDKLLADLEIEKLSTLPHILLKLMQECNNSDVSFDELSKLIRQDPALSSKIMHVANSPVYLQWGKANSFNRLLVVLGVSTIKTIAITSSVMQFFSQFAPERENYLKRFWYSSLHCAYTAKALAKLTSYEHPDEAYLAGLLHKLGQLILLDSFAEQYISIIESAKTAEDLAAEEVRQYGLTHSELGAWLIEQWKADDFIGDAVCYQSEAVESIQDAHPLVKLINLSSRFDNLDSFKADETFDAADQLFGLAQPVIADLLEGINAEVDDAAQSLNISIDSSLPVSSLKTGSPLYPEVSEERLELAKLVRNMALLDGTSQILRQANGIDETLLAIQHNMNILFGLGGTLFFLLDSENYLRGQVIPGQNPQLSRLAVPLEEDRSLISAAVLRNKPLYSFDEDNQPLKVLDRQIIRLMQKEGLIAIPLYNKSRIIGTMLTGIQQTTAHVLASQSDLLEVFSKEAASYIDTCLELSRQKEQEKEEDQAMYKLRARKVVHEANNPLGIINNYLYILGAKLGEDHPASNDLHIIKEEIERVGRILLRLPDEFQQEAPVTEGGQSLVDLQQMIQSLTDVFRSSLFSTHEIQADVELDRTVPQILTHRDRLKQVLINLIKNAAEAMPKGGKLLISSQDKVNVGGKPFVEITITDNGPGIPTDILENIFTPVSSTKGSAHSGLGLTIASNLIQELDGTISCRSNSKGTKFEILLPRILETETNQ